jgi:coenzyme F420-reducing hydrogenase delta subunit
MVDSVLKIYVFYCTNSLDEGQLVRGCGGLDGVTVKTIGLPCSGKIDIPYLVKAFETGADGVAIVTCKLNECRHLEGNLRANNRAEAVELLLEEIGMGRGRTAVIRLENKEEGAEVLLSKIKQFFETVRNLPQPCAH